ncbi:MAG: nucleotidyl transferase AbiEii/AbiGii toxin family protein [Candidatus Altiarchaeota archaeon]
MVVNMDLDILRLQALKTGLSLNYISKDEKLTELLSQLAESFPEHVVLKGGTALNRVHLSQLGVARFSEDVDLDYISPVTLNQKIKEIEKGMRRITGFTVSPKRQIHRTLRFNCSYVNELDHRDVVRAEFYLSHSKILAAKKPQKAVLSSPFTFGKIPQMICYCLEDLLGQKLVALHERTEGKDIYDAYYALDLDFDPLLLERSHSKILVFKKIRKTTQEFRDNLIRKLQKAQTEATYTGKSTNHYIPSNLRPNWKTFIPTLADKIESKMAIIK